MYLNLDSGHAERPSQNWVVVAMQSDRYAVAFDATSLGNGCSPAVAAPTTVAAGKNPIGPRP